VWASAGKRGDTLRGLAGGDKIFARSDGDAEERVLDRQGRKASVGRTMSQARAAFLSAARGVSRAAKKAGRESVSTKAQREEVRMGALKGPGDKGKAKGPTPPCCGPVACPPKGPAVR
jgi:hypothetical protein